MSLNCTTFNSIEEAKKWIASEIQTQQNADPVPAKIERTIKIAKDRFALLLPIEHGDRTSQTARVMTLSRKKTTIGEAMTIRKFLEEHFYCSCCIEPRIYRKLAESSRYRQDVKKLKEESECSFHGQVSCPTWSQDLDGIDSNDDYSTDSSSDDDISDPYFAPFEFSPVFANWSEEQLEELVDSWAKDFS
ncbi:MAG: hypothetical protein H7A37_02070 [Chlamydiales bacterium]|nr:hypothetical protein [Chlamydiia bacterium]MCP5507077.1 hypothetical protein [Chlamydiales bacterium]